MNFLLHILSIIAASLPGILGYNLVFGKGKIFHFGPVGISLATAYATFLTLSATGSYAYAIPAGFAAAAIAALLLAWLSLRLDPDGLAIMTIALHLAALAVVLNWTSLTRGALGIPRIPPFPILASPLSFALGTSAIAAAWTVFLWLLDRSRFGRMLTALAEHEPAAAAIGISRTRTHTISFLIGAAGAAMSGMLLPQYLRLLHPHDYAFSSLVFLVMVIVAGKPGNVRGVLFSTLLLALLKEGLRFLPFPLGLLGPLRLLLFGTILLIAIWLRRDALFPKPRTV